MKNRYSIKILTLIELLFAIFSISIAIYLKNIDFFGCDFNNDQYYLNTTDALPLYTKVNYIVECIKNGEWPSWFPYWYCGSTVCQYYPPLTYIILVPIEFFVKNDNISLQIYTFFGLLIGGMGVWYIFKYYIGGFWGIFAGILYSSLPYFSVSFFFWGVIAQVPIVAIAPWYLVLCFNYYKDPNWHRWVYTTLFIFILLLSHVMHAFMIAICVFVTFFILTIIQKKQFSIILIWGIGAAIGAGLLGFWWVTGVLPLENSEIPYLSPEASKGVTANFSWFFPSFSDAIVKYFPEMTNRIYAYFPITIVLVALFSYIFIKLEKNEPKKTVLIFLYIQTVFSFIFSFGYHLPLYKYLPLSKQLVPGRILTQTAIGAVILSAYFIGKLFIYLFSKKDNIKNILFIYFKKIGVLLLILIVFSFILYNHYARKVVATMADDFNLRNSVYSTLDNTTSNFEKGRLSWYGGVFGSMNTYFSLLYDYNIINGWNIEGTTLDDFILYQNTALLYEKKEYLLKNIYDMNIQTCLVDSVEFSWFIDYLKHNNFTNTSEVGGLKVLKRNNHSYFLEQLRDTLVIGRSSETFLSDYPWFVRGASFNPTDYSLDYFEKFNTIYYCEPEIENISQLKQFEQQLEYLSNMGKKIFIEFGRNPFPYEIYGVYPVSYTLEDNYYIVGDKLKEQFYTGTEGGYIVKIIGLDDVKYKLVRATGEFSVDILGTKKIGNNNVYFIGGPLNQLKTFAYNFYTGKRGYNELMDKRDKIISGIFDSMFDNISMYRSSELPLFTPENINWKANSCSFNYDMDTDKRIMASITYAPRWRVYVDNIETKVYRMENMLVFDLPKGKHDVKLIYGMTIYGKIGIGITVFSILLLIIVILFYNKLMKLLNDLSQRFFIYMNLLDKNKQDDMKI